MKRLRPSWRQPGRPWLWAAGTVVVIIFGAWLFESRVTSPVDSYAECVAAGNPVMESYPPVCRAGNQNFVGPGTAPTPPTSVAPAVSMPFELLVDGDSHGVYPHRQEIITTTADWRRYWREVHAGLPSPPPILPIDFSRDSVVAVSLGRQPTGGSGLKVTSIMTSATGTVVDVQETMPGEHCMVSQSPTNRYFIVRTGHLPEPVSFRLSTQKRNC